MLRVELDGEYCTVGARRDIDGEYYELVVDPDRRRSDRLELTLEPQAARRLVRELNRWLRVTKELA